MFLRYFLSKPREENKVEIVNIVDLQFDVGFMGHYKCLKINKLFRLAKSKFFGYLKLPLYVELIRSEADDFFFGAFRPFQSINFA